MKRQTPTRPKQLGFFQSTNKLSLKNPKSLTQQKLQSSNLNNNQFQNPGNLMFDSLPNLISSPINTAKKIPKSSRGVEFDSPYNIQNATFRTHQKPNQAEKEKSKNLAIKLQDNTKVNHLEEDFSPIHQNPDRFSKKTGQLSYFNPRPVQIRDKHYKSQLTQERESQGFDEVRERQPSLTLNQDQGGSGSKEYSPGDHRRNASELPRLNTGRTITNPWDEGINLGEMTLIEGAKIRRKRAKFKRDWNKIFTDSNLRLIQVLKSRKEENKVRSGAYASHNNSAAVILDNESIIADSVLDAVSQVGNSTRNAAHAAARSVKNDLDDAALATMPQSLVEYLNLAAPKKSRLGKRSASTANLRPRKYSNQKKSKFTVTHSQQVLGGLRPKKFSINSNDKNRSKFNKYTPMGNLHSRNNSRGGDSSVGKKNNKSPNDSIFRFEQDLGSKAQKYAMSRRQTIIDAEAANQAQLEVPKKTFGVAESTPKVAKKSPRIKSVYDQMERRKCREILRMLEAKSLGAKIYFKTGKSDHKKGQKATATTTGNQTEEVKVRIPRLIGAGRRREFGKVTKLKGTTDLSEKTGGDGGIPGFGDRDESGRMGFIQNLMRTLKYKSAESISLDWKTRGRLLEYDKIRKEVLELDSWKRNQFDGTLYYS